MTEIEQLKLRLESEILGRRTAEKELALQKENNKKLQKLTDLPLLMIHPDVPVTPIKIFKQVFDIYTDALFVIDKDEHALISCNETALRMFGFTDQTEMFSAFERLVFKFPDSPGQKNILSEAYRVDILFEGEFEFESGSGKKIIANIFFKPFSIQNKNYCLIQLADVTEKRRVEKNLIKSQKRYRDLINYSQALICTHDLNGIIINLNHAALDAIKIREDQAVGMNLAEIIPQEFAGEFHKYLQRIIENSSDKGIMLLLDKEGRRRFLMYQNYKVENDTDQPYIVGFAQDISERVMMERKLKKAITLAEASVNTRKIFLANMSHEMRTPLNGILGMAGLLAKTPLDPKQSGFLNIIRNSADNLLLIINDILDITKIESGKLQLEEITFNIADTIRNCVKSLIYKAEEKGLQIHLSNIVEGNRAIVKGDPFRLNQILLNLLNNSLKFTNTGYVEISNTVLTESVEGVVYEFAIKDTGIGIASEKLSKIFEGFTQADTHITRKYGGTGLGLNICKSLLHMQGGSITVESKPHQGSIFKFIIPYRKGAASEQIQNEIPKIDGSVLGDLKVLLVEDNEVNQYLAQSIMEEWGVEVVPAYNGFEALEKLKLHTFDMILMDIHMPEMDGLETTSIIRKMMDKSIAELPVIAITADALKGDEEKYISAGMNDYLTKPFNEEALFYKILKNLKLKAGNKGPQMELYKLHTINAAAGKLYDLSLIEAAAHGNPESVQRILNAFINSTPGILTQISEGLFLNKFNQVRQLAHKLKSSIDTLGITDLKKEIRILEKFSGEKEEAEILAKQFLQFQHTMSEVIRELKKDRGL